MSAMLVRAALAILFLALAPPAPANAFPGRKVIEELSGRPPRPPSEEPGTWVKPQIAADPLRPLEGLHDAIPPPKIVIDPEGWTPKAPKGVLAPDVRPWPRREIVFPHIDAPLDVVSPTTRLRSAIRDGPASARDAIARSGLDAPLPDWARAKKLEQLGPEYVGFDAFDDGAKFLVAKHGDDLAAIRVAGFRVDVVPQASGWLPAYERRLRGRVRLLSTGDNAWFTIVKTGPGARLIFPERSIDLTQDECAQIEAGTLPRDHAVIAALSTPGKLFVLHANALMQRNDAPALAFADSLARLTQALHPEARIVMDPLDGGTASRLAALSAFDRGATARLDAVLPDRAHGVLDGKLLQNLTSELVQEGATVATYARAKEAAAALGPNLLVIAGHSSAELASFVGDLGHHDVFRGRIVLFDACATPLTRQLAREIVTRYGANAVFVYEGVIGVNALEPATLDLVRDLGPRSTVTGGMLKRIRDALWKRRLRAVPHVLLDAHPGAAPA